MRQIKFRGYNKEENKFVFGYLFKDPIIFNYYIIEENSTNNNINIILVERSSIGQFTGMYDIEGKEIYEGDIVCCDELYFDNYLVKFHQGNFIVQAFNTKRPLRDPLDESYSIGVFSPDFKMSKTKLRIVSNIYEHK